MPSISSRTVLLALAGVYFVGGISLAFVSDSSSNERAFNLVLGIATMVAVYLWCKLKVQERALPPVGRLALWAAIFPPVFLPVYFIRTKASGGALRASGRALAYYVGVVALMFGGAIIAAVIRVA
jgi:hypothetical protein